MLVTSIKLQIKESCGKITLRNGKYEPLIQTFLKDIRSISVGTICEYLHRSDDRHCAFLRNISIYRKVHTTSHSGRPYPGSLRSAVFYLYTNVRDTATEHNVQFATQQEFKIPPFYDSSVPELLIF